MVDNVSRFPLTNWQRTKNRRGERAVHCIVSDRFIQFDVAAPQALEEGHPVKLKILTDRHPDKPWTHCELIVTVEGLELMVRKLREELDGPDRSATD